MMYHGELYLVAWTLSPKQFLHPLAGIPEHSIGGWKTARLFTAHEQGCVKHKKSPSQGSMGSCVGPDQNRPDSSRTIDQVYNTYGAHQLFTTTINCCFKGDRRDGTLHPYLQVLWISYILCYAAWCISSLYSCKLISILTVNGQDRLAVHTFPYCTGCVTVSTRYSTLPLEPWDKQKILCAFLY